jgi:hypothetical protein
VQGNGRNGDPGATAHWQLMKGPEGLVIATAPSLLLCFLKIAALMIYNQQQVACLVHIDVDF